MTNEEVINVLNTIYENPTASEQIKEACIVAMEAVDIKNSVERITTGLEISSEEKEEIEKLKGTMTNAEAIKTIKGIDFYTIEDKVAFDLAIKALEREEGWISVKDRLPETNDEFLLYGKIHEDEDYHIFIGPFDDGIGEKGEFGAWVMTSGGFDDFFSFAEVLAWQPLPKPYEEETK